MKKQIVVISGGDTFDSYEEYLSFLKDFQIDFERYRTGKKDWKRTLGETLGTGYEVIMPDMPNKINAKYVEWKIWFEKFVSHLEPEITLIGHSLGGTFLAKYLSENNLPRSINGIFLIAACYDDKDSEYSLADFILTKKLERLAKQSPKIFLYHSKDDPIVPYADFLKYQKELPNAVGKTFQDREHFNQESFPELIEDMKNLF